jgi:hypothetical protein
MRLNDILIMLTLAGWLNERYLCERVGQDLP